jgi:hypothetical protein
MASEYQNHVAKMMKQGHSMKAAAAEWRKMKGSGGAAKPKAKAKAKGGSIAMRGGALNMKGGGGARRRRTIVAAASHQGGLGPANEQIGDEDEGSGLNMAGGNFADSFLSGVGTSLKMAAPFIPLLL